MLYTLIMYIKSLYLKNIRSYTEQELEFSPGVNLLVGANNSGKSTIIKAIYKAQKGHSLAKQDIRKTQQQATIAIRFEHVDPNHLPHFRSLEGKNKTVPLLPLEAGRATVLFHLISEGQVNEQGYVYDPDDERREPRNLKVGPNEKGKQVNVFGFTKLPSNESEQNFMYPFFAKRKHYHSYHQSDEEAMYEVHEDLSNLAAKIQNISNASHPQSAEFNRLCKDILKFTVGLIPGDQHQRRIGIFVNNATTIPLEAMGEGVLNVLGLITILLTEDNKLFLIEELENDLHPAALKKLLELIISKSDRNQFIMSTHSNIVVKYLGSVPGSSVFHTTWQPYEYTQGLAPQVPTSQVHKLTSAPEDRMLLLENLGYDLFDYGIYSGFLILEESSAEQVIREFLIPHFAPSLSGRIRTIAAQGANDLQPKFNDLHRLFLFVHSDPIYKYRAWAVGDGDPAGVNNIQRLKESFKTWPEEHFVTFSQKAFEYYYPLQFQAEVTKVLGITSKREKKQAKAELLREVLQWARMSPQVAAPAFEESAAEVIQLLKKIEAEMIS